jgi:arsenate reductase (thioredoxin)
MRREALQSGVLVRTGSAASALSATRHNQDGGSSMSLSPDPATKHQVEHMVNDLCSEFAGHFSRDQIEGVMEDSFARVLETATVLDFVPLMAYRFTRERLNAVTRAAEGRTAGNWDVVFVSLSGGGRGQIAAAITTSLSDGRVSVHSAGTAARRLSDPGVRVVIEELGLDPDHEFARPVTDEVMHAADVIVTMGHSVGVVEIPAGVRHDDWRVGDPIGAPIDEVRRVRHDIEYRVGALLDDLGVPQREEAALADQLS